MVSLPLKIGDPKSPTFDLFGRLRNLTATITAKIFGNKHDIDNQGRALKNARGQLHRTRISRTFDL